MSIAAYLKDKAAKIRAMFKGASFVHEQKKFLIFMCLFFFSSGMCGLFINTFIYSCAYMSGEVLSGIKAVAYYNLCMYASMAFCSVVVGVAAKNANSRTFISIGAALQAAVYVLLIIFRANSLKILWIIGILSGVGTTFVNLNYSMSVSYVTAANNREFYFSWQTALNTLSAILSPFVAGLILKICGNGMGAYVTLFSISLVLVVAGLIHGFSLTYIDGKKGVTHFGNVVVYAIKNVSLRRCVIAEIINGMISGTTAFLLPVFLFSLNMSNMEVGVYALAFTLAQLVISGTVKKHINFKNMSIAAIVVCAIYISGGFVFMFGIGVGSVFAYGMINALGQCCFAAASFLVFYEAAYRMHNAHKKNLEILSAREFFIDIGRVIGTLTILVIPHDTRYLIYTLLILALLQTVACILVTVSRNELKETEKIKIMMG